MASLLSASAGLRIQPCLPCYRNIGVGKNPVLGPVSKAYPRSLKNPSSSGICIECSSRPKKKATAHHAKTRPKKHRPYDKNRKGPTKYEPFIFPPYPAPYLAMALKGPKPKKKPSFSDLISQMQQSLQTPVPAAGSAAQVAAEASAVVSTTTEDASVLAENSSAT